MSALRRSQTSLPPREDIMQVKRTLGALMCLMAAACSGAKTNSAAAPAAGAQALEGDQKIIAAAQQISDAVGGCQSSASDRNTSRVVSLETGVIVMLACGQGAYAFTNRLFVVRAGGAPELLSVPDYDTTGWFSTNQVNMPELDAGSGVLTTFRKNASDGHCGSEGRYQWDGLHFALQELQWRDCKDSASGGPPFPVIWPAQTLNEVDPNGATPEP
jgi:hypothetical protein